ncbi:MAG: hypothetical protein OXH70_17590 [Acidobacteria bacterium]|nr:hypothetical protein [Acidobacteriota bacterium]
MPERKLLAIARGQLGGLGAEDIDTELSFDPRGWPVFHLRRLLTQEEQIKVGPVKDIRGDLEQVARRVRVVTDETPLSGGALLAGESFEPWQLEELARLLEL